MEPPIKPKLPTMLITGASGIVGHQFLDVVKDDFIIFTVARRTQVEAGTPNHPNIHWLRADLAEPRQLISGISNALECKGIDSIDYVLHLASYYDFKYSDHPEYERTNVQGTRNILEVCKTLKIKRFVFASSLAACRFPCNGGKIDEKSPVDAPYPYARSKRIGEEMVKKYSFFYPCSIVRPAAVFTDWCEYGILYMLLAKWLSRSCGARCLGGKGNSAIPYIHSTDLNRLLLKIFQESEELPELDIYIAGPDGSTSQKELFCTSTRYYFDRAVDPMCLPKAIATPLVILRYFLGSLVGKRPFLRPWMLNYLDLKLEVDSSYTREVLGWKPQPGYHILRRLHLMIDKLRTNPTEWHSRNAKSLLRIPNRPAVNSEGKHRN